MKTDSSERTVWLPRTLAYNLQEYKVSQDKLKELLGSEYIDYNIVLAADIGRPTESCVLDDLFEKLQEYAKLPDVDFHSLRHSSTNDKLKLNKGDIKSTQGDTGHATAKMVMDVYSKI